MNPRTDTSSIQPATFGGFPPAAFQFYRSLEQDNSKDFWNSHLPVYHQSVRDPMQALLTRLAPQFGAGKVFRPNRDVRFSPDKRPYKEHQGGYVKTSTTSGFYVHVDADALLIGGGWYSSTADQVAYYRASVLGPPGVELARIVAELQEQGFQVGGERLKSRPRGVPADHPRVELLRHRTLTVQQEFPAETAWVATPEALERVRELWEQCRPLMVWLAAHATDPTPVVLAEPGGAAG